jgi:hypothetical protein
MTDQGIMNNTNDEAIVQAGVNPDFGVQDLYDSIAAGNYPSWTIYWQTLTPQQAENYKCLIPGFIWFPQADANVFPRQRSRPDQRYGLLSSNFILDTYISISRMARRRCTSAGNWSDHPCSESVRFCGFRYAPQLTFFRTNHFAEVEQIGFDPANLVCFFSKGPRTNKADFT